MAYILVLGKPGVEIDVEIDFMFIRDSKETHAVDEASWIYLKSAQEGLPTKLQTRQLTEAGLTFRRLTLTAIFPNFRTLLQRCRKRNCHDIHPLRTLGRAPFVNVDLWDYPKKPWWWRLALVLYLALLTLPFLTSFQSTLCWSLSLFQWERNSWRRNRKYLLRNHYRLL